MSYECVLIKHHDNPEIITHFTTQMDRLSASYSNKESKAANIISEINGIETQVYVQGLIYVH
jgi:hypothetical protein